MLLLKRYLGKKLKSKDLNQFKALNCSNSLCSATPISFLWYCSQEVRHTHFLGISRGYYYHFFLKSSIFSVSSRPWDTLKSLFTIAALLQIQIELAFALSTVLAFFFIWRYFCRSTNHTHLSTRAQAAPVGVGRASSSHAEESLAWSLANPYPNARCSWIATRSFQKKAPVQSVHDLNAVSHYNSPSIDAWLAPAPKWKTKQTRGVPQHPTAQLDGAGHALPAAGRSKFYLSVLVISSVDSTTKPRHLQTWLQLSRDHMPSFPFCTSQIAYR